MLFVVHRRKIASPDNKLLNNFFKNIYWTHIDFPTQKCFPPNLNTTEGKKRKNLKIVLINKNRPCLWGKFAFGESFLEYDTKYEKLPRLSLLHKLAETYK